MRFTAEESSVPLPQECFMKKERGAFDLLNCNTNFGVIRSFENN
jgi:hypothetical protein